MQNNHKVFKENHTEISEEERFEKVMAELKTVPPEHLPNHLLFIPDGNRRWAEKNGVSEFQGHMAGAKKMLEIIKVLKVLPIKNITAWGWSEDNFSRSEEEKKNVMNIMDIYINEILPDLTKENRRFKHRGRKNRLTPELKNTIRYAEQETAKNTGSTLGLAIDYGETYEQMRFAGVVRKHQRKGDLGVLTENRIKELEDESWKDTPPFDLIIRTAEGENMSHLSAIGPLASRAYTITLETYLPDTTPLQIAEAILRYANLEKRKGH